MRRLMAITAFALFLAVPVWAQRGGGGHAGGFGGGHGGGFGGHGGFPGGHAGFSGGHAMGGHSFGGTRGPGISRGFTHAPSSRIGFSRGPFLHDGFRGSRFGDRGFRDRDRGFRNRGFRDRGFRNFGFRNNCYGYGCLGYGYGYPWWYAGIDPWWWDNGSSYDEGYEGDRELANEMNEQNLEQQRMLRQEEAEGDQDAYARPPRREPEKPEAEAAAIIPPTVLVFRDQHKQEVQNYAIVGQTLWAFAPQHQKIPLSDLDVAATTKANDDRGVTFRVPSSNEAQ